MKLNLRFVFLKFIFRKKTPKTELKSAKDTTIKEDGEVPANLAKASVTSDVDDEKEKKKDRELLVK
jgi:hypothetical protein